MQSDWENDWQEPSCLDFLKCSYKCIQILKSLTAVAVHMLLELLVPRDHAQQYRMMRSFFEKACWYSVANQ
eukprot:COSAG02_NODE_2347_length_9092_cov_4.284666_9_plen_71_part_00